jgi:hypothetical protein
MNDDTTRWIEMMRFPKHPVDGDGQSCAIDRCELPAAFYRLRALPDTNSVGEPIPPFCLATGSGTEARDWALQTARMISRGLVGLSDPREP